MRGIRCSEFRWRVRWRETSGLTAAWAIAAAVAGCGGASSSHTISNETVKASGAGDGARRFSAAGMAIHFSYPPGFSPFRLERNSNAVGNTSNSTHAAVGIDPYDFLRVTRFAHRPVAVTAQNIAALKDGYDRAISQAVGQPVTSTVGALAGLPALRWPDVVDHLLARPVTLRIADVFVGRDVYELTCESTPAHQRTMASACREMLSTLTTSP